MKYLLLLTLLTAVPAKADLATGIVIGTMMNQNSPRTNIQVPANSRPCVLSLNKIKGEGPLLLNAAVFHHAESNDGITRVRTVDARYSDVTETVAQIAEQIKSCPQ